MHEDAATHGIVSAVALGMLLAACSIDAVDVHRDLFSAPPLEVSSPEDDSTGGEPSAHGWDTSEGPDGFGPLLDVQSSDLTAGEGPCAEVDLLFVIDDSGSMADEQSNLVTSFPGFIDSITTTLGPQASYHVGVVTTDAYEFNVPKCQVVGGLTVRTGGRQSSADECGPYAAGGNYMSVADDLVDAFSCAARVGIDGSGSETPMDAVMAALDPDGAAAACNAGFLRPDALLVLVIITDEEDFGDSVGDPGDWFDAVAEAKGGDDGRLVVLSLVGHEKPNACIPAQWTGMLGAELAPRIIELTEMFEHGTVGDVCAPDYAPFFQRAVDGIAGACDLFPPTG